MKPITQKLLPSLVLAASLPLFAGGAIADGTDHSHAKKEMKKEMKKEAGHGHGDGGHAENKADGHAGSEHAHGGGHKIDYDKVEEHAFGKASDPAKATTTINVGMADALRFDPSTVEVKRGDIVRFVVANNGKLMHEMVLGTKESLDEHAELMKKFPGMEHDEPHMAHISPGNKSTMGWQFTQAGEFMFGCLIPGHYDAGMVGNIIVR